MRGFLSNDSGFGRLMTRLGVIIAANVLFMISTVPVVTIGAGFAGLHHTILRMLRGDGVINPFKEFWKGFKSNFKQATIVWIGTLLFLGFLGLEWYWVGQFGGIFLKFRMGFVMIAVIALILFLYIYPNMAAFEASIMGLVRNSVYFAFKKPHHLVAILFFSVFPMVLTYSDLQMLPLYGFIWCTCGFGIVVLITDILLLRQFVVFLPPVDECGDFILDPEEEEKWADSPQGEGVVMKSEAEILEEMRKLDM